jgi:SNF2 family DNA or RNA helicase
MIKKDDVVELVTASKSDSTTSSEEENKEDAITTDVDNMERSPKIQAMFDIFADMAPDEKAVVFSQWTSHLDKIQKALEEEGHTFTRIDGSKSPSDRLDAIKSFSTEGTDSQETPRFILLSLHAAGTGLNLTRANVCIMMDCWYNFAIENQAIDRVHRIGQTRPVRAYRLIMKDTLEERMIKVQENKTALGKGSMQKLTLEERRLAKLTALKDLFAVDDEEENWQGVYDHTYENDPEWRG